MPDDVLDTTGDEALLREIRDRYDYASDAWREAREHRKVLMRYLCGNPWEDEDRKARKDAGRPCISHDELNQYVNQCVNQARQNKRGIKIEPRGKGATDKTAELRQDLARTIEYHSGAQSIYLRAFQDEVEGGYGFCRVSRRYVSQDPDGPDDQEIVVKPIANPDSVLYDPDCKEPDWSDAEYCFVLDPMPRETFRAKWPKAQATDFRSEDARTAPKWIQDRIVLVAEYWKVKTERVRNTRNTRWVERKTLHQYITNGVEILEHTEQPGEEIPIPAFIGMERYVDEGSGPKRKLFALPSFALDPQMSLAYLVSQEMEEAGQSPKSPYRGWKGQFESDAEAHETATKIPHAYLQYDYPDWALERGIAVSLPVREQFTPNFQQFEVAKDAARRAIQAAMGISPLPTAAQRQNEKSGVALQRIAQQQEIGSFHFMDGFERAIQRLGRIVNAWIPVTYDTEREMALHQADDSRRQVKLNTETPYLPEGSQEPEQHTIGDEEHDVTVSTGPSAASQREAASDFLDLLVSNLANLPVAPPQRAKLLSMAIKMKQLGPLGDEMADTISPDDKDQAAQAMAAIPKLQQQIQALNAYAKQKEAEVEELQQKIAAKVVEAASRKDLEQMKIEADLAKAEITTKAQSISERLAFVEDLIKQLGIQRHEAEMKASDQAHQQDMAAQQAQTASAQSAQDAAQQQAAAEAAAQQQPEAQPA